MRNYKVISPIGLIPVGRILKENSGGNYYHSMTDEEALSGQYMNLVLTQKQVDQLVDNKILQEVNLPNLTISSEDEWYEVEWTSGERWEMSYGYLLVQAKNLDEARDVATYYLNLKKEKSYYKNPKVLEVSKIDTTKKVVSLLVPTDINQLK